MESCRGSGEEAKGGRHRRGLEARGTLREACIPWLRRPGGGTVMASLVASSENGSREEHGSWLGTVNIVGEWIRRSKRWWRRDPER